jgi:hypothetical protein
MARQISLEEYAGEILTEIIKYHGLDGAEDHIYDISDWVDTITTYYSEIDEIIDKYENHRYAPSNDAIDSLYGKMNVSEWRKAKELYAYAIAEEILQCFCRDYLQEIFDSIDDFTGIIADEGGGSVDYSEMTIGDRPSDVPGDDVVEFDGLTKRITHEIGSGLWATYSWEVEDEEE